MSGEINLTKTYISLDLETTGLNPKTDRIIEIGALKVVEGQPVDTFSTFVNPGRRLTERIVELTGITDEQLKDAPVIGDVFPELMEFIGDAPLLGHSIHFDYAFVKKAAVDRKLTFERKGIDTLKIARKFLPDLPHRNLGYLCEYYQISLQAHRALADAEATHKLYKKLVENFYKEEEALFSPSPLQFKVKRDTPATKAQKERLYRLIGQHNITLEVDVELLTRSEASRMIDKISLQFGR